MKLKFVTTKAVYDWTGDMVHLRGFFYSGPVAMCGGPSAQQEDLAAQQAAFYKSMTAQQSQQFANQTSILTSLQKSWQPVLDAGINQYGFSKAEDTAMRTQATDLNTQNYQNAAKAASNRAAIQGGDSYLPSGVQEQIQAGLASDLAGTQSQQQLGITEAGYAQGRQNYEAASSVMSGAAQIYNPQGTANAANTSGSDAYTSAKQNATQSSQMWAQIGGMVGGAAMDVMAPGLTKSFNNAIGL